MRIAVKGKIKSYKRFRVLLIVMLTLGFTIINAPHRTLAAGVDPIAQTVYGQGGSFTTIASGTTTQTLASPESMVSDSSGNVYIADSNNNRVLYYPTGSTTATRVYGQAGSFTTSTASTTATGLNFPTGVALDSSGNLYVADSYNNRVLYYAGASTTATRVYGQAGSFTTSNPSTTATGLNAPNQVALDSSNNLYVADTTNNRVLYYTSGSTTATRVYGQAGSFTTSTASATATGLSTPTGLALDSSGNLYVADNNNNRALYYAGVSTTATRVYGQAGSFTNNAANNGFINPNTDTLNAPTSITVDSAGNVVIADQGNYRVLYYPGTSTTATRVYGQGSSFTTHTSGSASPSSFNLVYDVWFGINGNLYIADSSNNRVLSYQTSLAITTQPAASTNAGSSFSAAIRMIDVGANSTFTDFTGTVTIAIKAGTGTSGAVLSGTTSVSAVSGVATFPNLSINLAGAGYILTASSSGAGSANTNTFTITTISASVSPNAFTVYGQSGSYTTSATSSGVSATSLSAPEETTLDGSGNLYVADTNNNRVLYYTAGSITATRVYGQGGSFTSSTANNGGISATSLNQPRGLALDSSGNLYITDTGNNRVLYYTTGSTTATRIYGQGGSYTSNTVNNGGVSATSLNQPYGVALDSSNNLYIADTYNHRVLYYPAGSTTATNVYGQAGSGTSNTANNGGLNATGLNYPSGVNLDNTNNLYVSDYGNDRVLYYASGSTTATRVYGQGGSYAVNTINTGGISANSLYGPRHTRLDSSNNLYVADYLNNRVLYYPSGSTTATRVYGQAGSSSANTANNGGISSTSLSTPGGIALDSSNNLYLSDSANNRVLYYPSGSTTATRVYGQIGLFTNNTVNDSISANSLNNPYGTVLDGSGNLYVADAVNNRVLYYPSGITTAARVYGQGGSFTTAIGNNGGISADSLYQPAFLTLDSHGGLYIADFGNNRVLYYPSGSTTATRVYGQAGSFTTNTVNNGGISANSLNQPYDIAVDGSDNVYITDTNNNRVLYYVSGSTTATRVYGQGGVFTTNTVNKGGISANSLQTPQGVILDGSGNLYIDDTANNRILYYTAGSTTATRVYGQGGVFTTNTNNKGGISATSLSGPNKMRLDTNNNLYLADFSNNRVLYYPSNTTTATRVYGQAGSFTTGTVNNGGIGSTSLNGPIDVTVDSSNNIYVVDYGNNRVLKYQTALAISTQPPASTSVGSTFSTVASLVDVGSGGTFNDFTGTVTIAIKAGTGTSGAVLSGTSSIAAVNGYATFPNLSINKSGSGYILTASNASYGSADTNTFIIATITANVSPKALTVYGQSGSFTATASNSGISATSLNTADGIARDSSNNLYVADTSNHRILYYPAGTTIATRVYGQAGSFTTNTANNGGISANSLSSPVGLTLDSSGNLYVADFGNNRILYYPAGTTTATRVYGQAGNFTTNTANNGGVSANSLNQPIDVKLDSSGNVYISDNSNFRVLYFVGTSTTATRVYGQAGSFTTNTGNNGGVSATSLNGISGLALDSSNNLYVGDFGNNRVLYYTTGSTTATRVYGQASDFTATTANNGGVSATSLSGPYGVALDSTGNLYIADGTNNRVLYYTAGSITATRVYGQAGSFTTNTLNNGGISTTSLYRPYFLTLDSGNNLYIADSKNSRILYYASGSTTATRVYGQTGAYTTNTINTSIDANSLSSAARVTLDSSGNLYIADNANNRVLYYPSGSTTATVVYGQGGNFTTNPANNGGISATSLANPTGIAVDSSGNLYIADTANNRVLYYTAGSTTATRVYGQGGNFTTNTLNNGGISTTSLYQPNGVALDTGGNLYIADTANNRVLYYTAGSTTATRVYGQAGSFTTNTVNNGGLSSTSLNLPAGVAVDSSGNVYITDNTNNRILYYTTGSTTATRVYGQAGSFTTNTVNNGGVSATSLNGPVTTKLDGAGNLYVADKLNNRVLYYPAGSTTATRVYGQGGSLTANTANNGGVSFYSLLQPNGLALDGNGNIYTTDSGNNRVLRYQTALNVSTQPPASTTAGSTFSTATNLIDVGSGSVFTDFIGTVAIAIKSGSGTSGAVLSGTTSVATVNGVATFSNLSLNLGGAGYILSTTSPGVGSANTSAFSSVGPLLFTPLTTPSFTYTLTGAAGTITSQQTFKVNDTTLSGVGWHVTITSTQFTGAGGITLPTTSLKITDVSTACTAGQTCVVATNGVSGYPLTVPSASTAPAAIYFFSAAGATGTGDVTVTATFSLNVPAGTTAGTYTSTVSIVLVKGQ